MRLIAYIVYTSFAKARMWELPDTFCMKDPAAARLACVEAFPMLCYRDGTDMWSFAAAHGMEEKALIRGYNVVRGVFDGPLNYFNETEPMGIWFPGCTPEGHSSMNNCDDFGDAASDLDMSVYSLPCVGAEFHIQCLCKL